MPGSMQHRTHADLTPPTMHTPGPWRVEDNSMVVAPGSKSIKVTVEGKECSVSTEPVAMVFTPRCWEEDAPPFKERHAANARLVAHAPELLEALLMQQGACCGTVDTPPCQWCRRSLAVMDRIYGREVEHA